MRNKKLVAILSLLCTFALAVGISACGESATTSTSSKESASSTASADTDSGSGFASNTASDVLSGNVTDTTSTTTSDTTSDTTSETPAAPTLTLDKTELSLKVGATDKATATVTGTTDTVTWTTDNAEVATVGEDGTITALKAGTAVITATVGGVEQTLTLTVTDEVLLTLETESLALNAAQYNGAGVTSSTIVASVTINGTAAESPTFTYVSSAASIAEVDANGVVTGKDIGTAQIEVRYEYGGETYKKTVSVNVTKLVVDSDEEFLFGKDKSAWYIDVARFGLTAEDVIGIATTDGEDYVVTDDYGDIQYDGTKAIVITDGIDVETKTAADYITIETDLYSFNIKVAYVTSSNVEFVREGSPMKIGETKKLTLKVFGIEVQEAVTWSVDKTRIATISEDGTLTAVNYGTAVVRASVYGYEYVHEQIVYDTVEIDQETEAVGVGGLTNGYAFVPKASYKTGDWLSFSFTPSEDFESGMFVLLYGTWSADTSRSDCTDNYVFAGVKKFYATGFDDSSFIILDSNGTKLGSFADAEGMGTLKADETYTVFVQFPSSKYATNYFYYTFASLENQIGDNVMNSGFGIAIKEENMTAYTTEIAYSGYLGYKYNGETREVVALNNNSIQLSTEKLGEGLTIDVPEEITDTILAAKLQGSDYDVFVVDENGLPLVVDGKLTVDDSFTNYKGTDGKKVLVIETEDINYELSFELIPTDTMLVNSVITPEVSTQIMAHSEYASMGTAYLAFDFYVYNDINSTMSLFLVVDGRHTTVTNSYIYIGSLKYGWQIDYYNIPSDYFCIYDQEGNLVNDTVSTAEFGTLNSTAQNTLQAKTWYHAIINLDGRYDKYTDNDGVSIRANGDSETGMLQAYYTNVTLLSKADVYGIILDKASATISTEDEQALTLTASLKGSLTDKTVEWTSSDPTIATVENGVVKAVKAGKVTITAKNSEGKTDTCEVTVLGATKVLLKKYDADTDSYVNDTILVDGSTAYYVRGDEATDYNAIRFTFTVTQSFDYLFLTTAQTWGAGVSQSTVVGTDRYSYGLPNAWGTFSCSGADASELLIQDEEGNVLGEFNKAGFTWEAGKTYTITYKLAQGLILYMFLPDMVSTYANGFWAGSGGVTHSNFADYLTFGTELYAVNL